MLAIKSVSAIILCVSVIGLASAQSRRPEAVQRLHEELIKFLERSDRDQSKYEGDIEDIVERAKKRAGELNMFYNEATVPQFRGAPTRPTPQAIAAYADQREQFIETQLVPRIARMAERLHRVDQVIQYAQRAEDAAERASLQKIETNRMTNLAHVSIPELLQALSGARNQMKDHIDALRRQESFERQAAKSDRTTKPTCTSTAPGFRKLNCPQRGPDPGGGGGEGGGGGGRGGGVAK
jgi:murein L,D-transpeptidase YcbB/YkuD